LISFLYGLEAEKTPQNIILPFRKISKRERKRR